MGSTVCNAAVQFIDDNVAKGRGGKTAFIDPERSVTYGELKDRAGRVGPALRRLGLRREDRIALLLQDTVDFPVAFFGAIRAGMIPIPLNTLLSVDQVRYILQDSRAKAVVVSPVLLATAEAAAHGLECANAIIVAGREPSNRPALGALLDNEMPDAEPAATSPDEIAFWLYSSGSTGMPKGVKHVHSSMMETARLFGQAIVGIREDDIVFSAAKCFFAYGLGNSISFPMSVGATTVFLPERPTPKSVFDLLKHEEPTLFFGVPTLYAAILADETLTREAGSSRLRLCVSAGEPLPEHVGLAWRERFGVDILDGIGSTEMLHIFVSNRVDAIVYGTTGQPVPGYEVRLVDDLNRDVPDGEFGELLVRGPTSAEGYWNLREKSRRTFEGEWVRTGDKYVREPSGCYRYCGRTDDLFKVSGIWVSPFEIESALVTHPAVLEAAVVAAEDEEGLLKPKAFIVLKDGAGSLATNELKEHVKQAIGAWKYPRWIEVVESLPKTATGKIQRFKLRAGAGLH